jgi:hypothetical protein
MLKVAGFLAAAKTLLIAMSKNNFLMSCLNWFRSIFHKNTIFMPLYGDILQTIFLT